MAADMPASNAVKALSLDAPYTWAWRDVPEPAMPGEGEALAAIRRIGVCGTDIAAWHGKMPFINGPRIPGHELGVEVLAIGGGVHHVKPGDACAVEPYLHCGRCAPCLRGLTNCCESLHVLGVHSDGGMCPRLLLPAAKLHPAPLSHDVLALIEPLAIGAHAVERAALTAGESAIILGAGPIGLAVAESLRSQAVPFVIVEVNAARRAWAAVHLKCETLPSLTPAKQAAVVFDATGHPGSMAQSFQHAAFGGRVVFVGITAQPVPLDDALFHRRELTLLATRNARAIDFQNLIHAIRQHRMDPQPWITHRAPLSAVPDVFASWLHPDSGLVKAVISVDG